LPNISTSSALQTLCPAAAGQNSKHRFGQSDLVGAVSGKAKVACQRDFVAAAHAVAVDRRDHRLGHQHDAIEHAMKPGGRRGKALRARSRVGGHRGQLVDAVVRDELSFDSAGEDNRARAGVVFGASNQLQQLLRHRRGHVVHRRIADRPDLNIVMLLDGKMFHGISPQTRE
jgi:hypothetical protein